MNFRQFVEGPLDDIEAWRREQKLRGPVVNRRQHSDNSVLKLFHGFSRDPESFGYVFDPKQSEQGLLWFTHALIRGYDAWEYAANHGDYVLTYSLPIKKHYEIVTYQNGDEEKNPHPELEKLAVLTENSRYMVSFDDVIELPEGWFFTYKSEKFIGTNQVLRVSPDQIQKV